MSKYWEVGEIDISSLWWLAKLPSVDSMHDLIACQWSTLSDVRRYSLLVPTTCWSPSCILSPLCIHLIADKSRAIEAGGVRGGEHFANEDVKGTTHNLSQVLLHVHKGSENYSYSSIYPTTTMLPASCSA